MEKQMQVELIQELLDLTDEKSPYMKGDWEQGGIERYLDEGIFKRECEKIFSTQPLIAAHASELPEPGSFKTVDIVGKPILLVRDDEGTARAFYNVCRHRGATLVGEESGCKKRFSCPYHAWTYNTQGDLIAVPHEKTGFPGLDRSTHGLHAVPCKEYAGWIWVCLDESAELDPQASLGELAPEFEAIDAGSHVVFESTVLDLQANWKILVEGGLEAYHFRVAHRNTIAPLFMDNLSSYRAIGRHLRSVLPRSTMPDLADTPNDSWDINQHANVLYSLFPGPQFLVQEDHFVWIQSEPVSASRTISRLSTVVPADQVTEERRAYWEKNHALTIKTLKEDFDLGEGIQKGLSSGANAHLNFGRYESALSDFNRFVDEMIA